MSTATSRSAPRETQRRTVKRWRLTPPLGPGMESPFVGTEDTDTTQSCGGYPVVVLQQLKSGPSGINLLNQITWAYAGHVVASGSSALACPASTDPTWN